MGHPGALHLAAILHGVILAIAKSEHLKSLEISAGEVCEKFVQLTTDYV